MFDWARSGDIPIDPSHLKFRGGEKAPSHQDSYSPMNVETSTTRFLKKLIIEENMHLVKMSSKSGNCFSNGLTIQQLQHRLGTAGSSK